MILKQLNSLQYLVTEQHMVGHEYYEVVSPLLLHRASLKVLYLGVVTRERIPTDATITTTATNTRTPTKKNNRMNCRVERK